MEQSIKDIELKIQKYSEEIEGLREDLKPIQNKIDWRYNRIRSLKNDIVDIRSGDGDTDWEWLLSVSDINGSEKYYLRNSKLAEIGLASSGYFPETNQACVRVILERDCSDERIDEVYEGLLKIRKYITPIKTEDGTKVKIFDIFEYTLSESGSYSLFFNVQSRYWSVVFARFGRKEKLYSHKNLKKVLDHIRKHHYYE